MIYIYIWVDFCWNHHRTTTTDTVQLDKTLQDFDRVQILNGPQLINETSSDKQPPSENNVAILNPMSYFIFDTNDCNLLFSV